MAASDQNVRASRRNPQLSAAPVAIVVTAAALITVAGIGVAAQRTPKWWWDNLAGPDSSNFVELDQIKKSNVDQLEVAW